MDISINIMKTNNNRPPLLGAIFSVLIAFASTIQSRAEWNTVVSWGDTTNVPNAAKNVRALSAGWEHTLAIAADGSLLNWGNQSAVPPSGLSNLIAVAAGWGFSVAVPGDGTVVTWGERAWRVPVPPGLSNIVAVSANGDDDGAQVVALARDGTVYAWGDVSEVPPDLTNAKAIAAGGWHGVALRSDGTVAAWGDDTYGQTDLPESLTNVIAIASGDWHSLALKADGTVVTWGLPGVGDLEIPEDVTNVIAIAAGQYYNLALRKDGKVIGWGPKDFGTGSGQIDIPSGLTNVTAISAGTGHAVAVTTPLQISALTRVASLPQIHFHTFSDQYYAVEYSANIAAPVWELLRDQIAGTGAEVIIGDTNAAATLPSARFYRLRQ